MYVLYRPYMDYIANIATLVDVRSMYSIFRIYSLGDAYLANVWLIYPICRLISRGIAYLQPICGLLACMSLFQPMYCLFIHMSLIYLICVKNNPFVAYIAHMLLIQPYVPYLVYADDVAYIARFPLIQLIYRPYSSPVDIQYIPGVYTAYV